jgi:hypothetical protein
MRPIKSPGAVAALGASGIDRLGRQVVSEINLSQSSPQAPICSGLGSHRCGAARIVAYAHVDGVEGGP